MNNDKDNELDDLIVYAPDEDDSTEETIPQFDSEEENITPEPEEEEVSSTGLSPEEEAELDKYELAKTSEEIAQPEPEKKKNPIKRSHTCLTVTLTALAAVFLITVVFFFGGSFFEDYGNNFRRNITNLLPALFVEEVSDEEVAADTTVFVEDDGKAVVYKEYKEANIETNEESNTDYVFGTKRTYMIPYEGAADGAFSVYGEGIVCARSNNLSYINKEGKTEWVIETAIASPLLKSEGKYILAAENGGSRFALYEGSELLYDLNCGHRIKNCNVSAGGDVVLVLDKDGYKGGISVYNRYGKEVFIWSSGQNEVLCADISSASRRVSAGLLNCDSGVYSIIQIFDITKEDPSAAVRFDNTIIFDIGYTGDIVTGYGDNSMICMTSTGRVIIDRRYDKVEIAHNTHDNDGNKAILFDSDNIPIIQVYNRKGTIKSEMVAEELADCMDIEDNYVIYNSGRDVLLRKSGSERVRVYTATMDILGLHIIDRNTFAVIHSNSIEIVVME